MKQRIDPRQIILGMMAKACTECKRVQHVWFSTQKEWDEWTCPYCTGRIKEKNEDEIDEFFLC